MASEPQTRFSFPFSFAYTGHAALCSLAFSLPSAA